MASPERQDGIEIKRYDAPIEPGTTAGELIKSLGANPRQFEFLIGSPDTILGDTTPYMLSPEQSENLRRLLREHGFES